MRISSLDFLRGGHRPAHVGAQIGRAATVLLAANSLRAAAAAPNVVTQTLTQAATHLFTQTATQTINLPAPKGSTTTLTTTVTAQPGLAPANKCTFDNPVVEVDFTVFCGKATVGVQFIRFEALIDWNISPQVSMVDDYVFLNQTNVFVFSDAVIEFYAKIISFPGQPLDTPKTICLQHGLVPDPNAECATSNPVFGTYRMAPYNSSLTIFCH